MPTLLKLFSCSSEEWYYRTNCKCCWDQTTRRWKEGKLFRNKRHQTTKIASLNIYEFLISSCKTNAANPKNYKIRVLLISVECFTECTYMSKCVHQFTGNIFPVHPVQYCSSYVFQIKNYLRTQGRWLTSANTNTFQGIMGRQHDEDKRPTR